jgi:hypothetical protein
MVLQLAIPGTQTPDQSQSVYGLPWEPLLRMCGRPCERHMRCPTVLLFCETELLLGGVHLPPILGNGLELCSVICWSLTILTLRVFSKSLSLLRTSAFIRISRTAAPTPVASSCLRPAASISAF